MVIHPVLAQVVPVAMTQQCDFGCVKTASRIDHTGLRTNHTIHVFGQTKHLPDACYTR